MIPLPNLEALEDKEEPAIINTKRRHIAIKRRFHNLMVSFHTNVVGVVSEGTMKKGASTLKLVVKKNMAAEYQKEKGKQKNQAIAMISAEAFKGLHKGTIGAREEKRKNWIINEIQSKKERKKKKMENKSVLK